MSIIVNGIESLLLREVSFIFLDIVINNRLVSIEKLLTRKEYTPIAQCFISNPFIPALKPTFL